MVYGQNIRLPGELLTTSTDLEISNKITVTPIDRLKPALTENNLHNINTNDINTEQSDKKVTFNIMAVKFSEGE